MHSQALQDIMMKFASIETVVELIYKYAIPSPKDQRSKPFSWECLQVVILLESSVLLFLTQLTALSLSSTILRATVGDVSSYLVFIALSSCT